MSSEEEKEFEVIKFRSKGEQNYMFACHVAVSLVFTPDLLYHLWNNFRQYQYFTRFYKISHIAVADLLAAPFCKKVGLGLYEFADGFREIFLKELCENLGEARKLNVAAFLADYAKLENRFAHRRGLKNIHLLTAQSILNPSEMERQIISFINESSSDAEKLKYLLLHKQLLPLGFQSDFEKITSGLSDDMTSLSPILIPERDDGAEGLLHVKLPAALNGKISQITKEARVKTRRTYMAEQITWNCLKELEIELNLGNCGLVDEDFDRDTELYKLIIQCTHLQVVILGNTWKDIYNRDIKRSNNSGPPNFLSQIPLCIIALPELTDLHCNGGQELPWAIRKIPALTHSNLNNINLSYNQLEDIDGLRNLTGLKYLFLGHNKIRTLAGLENLKELMVLDLQSNKLTDISFLAVILKREHKPLLISWKKGEGFYDWEINIYGNPLQIPPIEIIMQGTRPVLAYLHRLAEEYRQQLLLKKRTFLGWIGSIENVWSGFLIKGNLIFEGLGDRFLFVTCLNDLGENLNRQKSTTLTITLQQSNGQSYSFSNWSIIWASVELNVVLIDFNDENQSLILKNVNMGDALTIANKITSNREIYLTGFDDGIEFRVELDERGVLDSNERLFTYESSIGPGSGGGAVLDHSGELIGMHMSKSDSYFIGLRISFLTKELERLFDLPLNELINRYHFVRETMPAGHERTAVFHGIFSDMKKMAERNLSKLPILTTSTSAGERLAAIACLHVFPNPEYLNWIALRVGDDEMPFLGYQASVALLLSLKIKDDQKLMDAYRLANSNLQISKFKDPNQVTNINRLLSELKSLGAIPSPREDGLDSIQGLWSGFYVQQGKQVEFVMEAWLVGNMEFSGMTNEESDLGKADITGSLDLNKRKVTFSKRYRKKTTGDYIVQYEGYWDDKLEVRGLWSISSYTSNSFIMHKS